MKHPQSLCLVAFLSTLFPLGAQGACCYVAAKDKDVNQPSQKVFICRDSSGVRVLEPGIVGRIQ